MPLFLKNCMTLLQTYFPLLCRGLGVVCLLSLSGTGGALLLALPPRCAALLLEHCQTEPDTGIASAAGGKGTARRQKATRALFLCFSLPLQGIRFVLLHTPFLLQAMLLHFLLEYLVETPANPFFSGVAALSLYGGAALSKDLSGMLTKDRLQKEGTPALCFRFAALLFRCFSDNIGRSAVLSVINVTELLFFAKLLRLQTGFLLESYLLVFLLYLLLSVALECCVKLLLHLGGRAVKKHLLPDGGANGPAEAPPSAALSNISAVCSPLPAPEEPPPDSSPK